MKVGWSEVRESFAVWVGHVGRDIKGHAVLQVGEIRLAFLGNLEVLEWWYEGMWVCVKNLTAT